MLRAAQRRPWADGEVHRETTPREANTERKHRPNPAIKGNFQPALWESLWKTCVNSVEPPKNSPLTNPHLARAPTVQCPEPATPVAIPYRFGIRDYLKVATVVSYRNYAERRDRVNEMRTWPKLRDETMPRALGGVRDTGRDPRSIVMVATTSPGMRGNARVLITSSPGTLTGTEYG